MWCIRYPKILCAMCDVHWYLPIYKTYIFAQQKVIYIVLTFSIFTDRGVQKQMAKT